MKPGAAPAIEKGRLAGLQDGAYSIAMTLLVLELKLPTLGTPLTDAMLWSALIALWPKLLTWLLSFWVLALFWAGDARALAAVEVVDAFLMRLVLLRIALVSLVPFSTALIGEHGDHVPAAAVYSAHLLVLAATQSVRDRHLRGHSVIAGAPGAAVAGDAALQAGVTLACATLAFALAFVAPGYNMFALIPILFLRLFRRR